MQRLHLIEIEDQPWCPSSIRDAMTDYLQFVLSRMQPYLVIASRLRAAMRHAGTQEIVDLCSGGGGPWLGLIEVIGGDVRVTLTDRYPNEAGKQRVGIGAVNGLRYEPAEVDATAVPERLPGFRTLFNSFHHFPPAEARAILENAVRSGQGIGVFEVVERTGPQLAGMLLAPLFVFLCTPFIRPFRWSRLFWTYLVPVVPLFTMIDGIVSCLRVYGPEELRQLTHGLTGYDWEIGQEQVPGSPARVTYLVGYPSTGIEAPLDSSKPGLTE